MKKKHFVKRFFVTLLISILLFPVSTSASNKQSKIENTNLNENQIYEEIIEFSKEDIEKLKKNNNNDKFVYLDPTKFKEGKNKYINPDKIKIDLEELEHVKIAKKQAEEKGHDWSLGSLTIVTKFKKEDGTYLTKGDYKKIISDRKRFGEEKSIQIVSENANLESEEKTQYQDKKQFSTNALNLGSSSSKSYKFLTSYAYVYNEDSGSKRRHYVIGRHIWNSQWSWGAVTTHDYDNKPDILVGAWSIGRIEQNANRGVYVSYENSSGKTITRTASQLSEYTVTSNPAHVNAWKVYERIGDYRIKYAEVYNYTGWYYRNRESSNGEFKTQYGHGFSNNTLDLSIGVSYPAAVSITITPTNNTVREIAQSYALMKID